MRNLLDHTAKSGGIGPLHHLVDLAQSQAPDNHLVLFRSADRTAHQLDLDLGFHVIAPFPGSALASPASRSCPATARARRPSPSPRCADCACRSIWSERWECLPLES